ncbi:hypothetical protein CHS0354_001449, partial [Potamilus streckersoni]
MFAVTEMGENDRIGTGKVVIIAIATVVALTLLVSQHKKSWTIISHLVESGQHDLRHNQVDDRGKEVFVRRIYVEGSYLKVVIEYGLM